MIFSLFPLMLDINNFIVEVFTLLPYPYPWTSLIPPLIVEKLSPSPPSLDINPPSFYNFLKAFPPSPFYPWANPHPSPTTCHNIFH